MRTIPSVVIIIPVYKDTLSRWEEISLLQMNRVLGKYPRVFVAPESLTIKYGVKYNCRTVRFPDANFTGITSYSRMMLDVNFYRRFADYDYMLIYQTDAFVFSDRLAEFCHMNYDYIGAPVFRFSPMWHTVGTSVGNGGFSLRKVSSFIRILEQRNQLWDKNPFTDLFELYEDLFWGFCGADKRINFRIPDAATALQFAVQDDIMHSYRKMPQWLPFGCHYWNKPGSIRFWAPIVAGYGYDLGEINDKKLYFPREIALIAERQRKKKHFFSLQPLFHAMLRENVELAVQILAKWLQRHSEGDAAWKNTSGEFMCLWRKAELNFARTGEVSWKILREILGKAIVRAVSVDGLAQNYYLWQGIERYVKNMDSTSK